MLNRSVLMLLIVAGLTIAPLIPAQAGWFDFWNRRPDTRLGTRSEICPITGQIGKQPLVWNDRPMFIWQGQAAQLRLRLDDAQTMLWTRSLSQADQATIAETPLQPGQTYEWQVLKADAKDSDRQKWVSFQVMPQADRAQIAQDLKAIEQKSRTMPAEQLALEKAAYFVDRSLWSDALQSLYEVKNPSAEFVAKRRSMIADLCVKQSS